MNGRTKASIVLMSVFSTGGLFFDIMAITVAVSMFTAKQAENFGEAVGLVFATLFEVLAILMLVAAAILTHGASCLVYLINRKHLTEGTPKRALFVACMVGLGIIVVEVALLAIWIISSNASSGSSAEAQTAAETAARMLPMWHF